MPYELDFRIPLQCITKDELLDRIDEKQNCVIVDTIGNYNGNKIRIAGAKTIPYPEVIDRRNELLSYDEIIIYCRRKDCRASKKVAAGLTVLNIPDVKVYEGGLDEWVSEGLPVEPV